MTLSMQSRRDDMESICYLILYLIKKQLPWQGLKCDNKNEKYDKKSVDF